VVSGGVEFLGPHGLAEALRLRADRPDALLIAGGTDVMVELNLGERRPPALLDLGGLAELRGHRESPERVTLRAGSTFAQIIDQFAGQLPALVAAARTVGSPQIRNRATLGGNLGTASPAGDAHPVLLALGATIRAVSLRGVRDIPAAEFFLGPGRSALAPDELILEVAVPVTGPMQSFAKVGTRNAMVIAVCSFALCLDPVARRVGTGIGSAAPVPLCAPDAQEQLTEALDRCGWEPMALSSAVVVRFAELVAAAARPIDDHRGSAAYRRHALGVLARRALGWLGAPASAAGTG
jgi:CO/xanthine dehydrogenase FAD-binding subunit